jgi:hypothetical protein
MIRRVVSGVACVGFASTLATDFYARRGRAASSVSDCGRVTCDLIKRVDGAVAEGAKDGTQ